MSGVTVQETVKPVSAVHDVSMKTHALDQERSQAYVEKGNRKRQPGQREGQRQDYVVLVLRETWTQTSGWIVASFQSDTQMHTVPQASPSTITIHGTTYRKSTNTPPARIATSHSRRCAQRVFSVRSHFPDCGSDMWTKLVVDGGATTHVYLPWFALQTPIQSLDWNSWLRHLRAADGHSLTCRGTRD